MPAMTRTLAPWPENQPLPVLLTDTDLMRVVQLQKSAFYRHKARGTFRRFEAQGINLGATRYSGEQVERYVRRSPLNYFGRKRVASRPRVTQPPLAFPHPVERGAS